MRELDEREEELYERSLMFWNVAGIGRQGMEFWNYICEWDFICQ